MRSAGPGKRGLQAVWVGRQMVMVVVVVVVVGMDGGSGASGGRADGWTKSGYWAWPGRELGVVGEGQ